MIFWKAILPKINDKMCLESLERPFLSLNVSVPYGKIVTAKK